MNERISALMDGEVDASQLSQDLARLKSSSDLRRTWDAYHLIGDALRGPISPALTASVSQRLAAEPTVLAPRRSFPRGKIARLAFSVAAGAAGVALVVWMALPGLSPAPLQVAISAPAGKRPVSDLLSMPPAAVGVENYLLVHQAYSPAGAMQGVASYVRTVADERGVGGK